MTIITSTNQPELSQANRLPEVTGASDPLLGTIAVTSEFFARLYGALYIMGKPFADRMNDDNPEVCIVYQHSIMNELKPALTKSFPDFEQFDVKVSTNGAIVGQNVFTNTVLQFMNNLMAAPMGPDNKMDPSLIYTPSLPQVNWNLGNDYDHEEDDENY